LWTQCSLGIDQGFRNDAFMTESGSGWDRVVVSWRAAQPTSATDFSNLNNVLPPAQLQAEVARGVKLAGLLQFTPAGLRPTPTRESARHPRT